MTYAMIWFGLIMKRHTFYLLPCLKGFCSRLRMRVWKSLADMSWRAERNICSCWSHLRVFSEYSDSPWFRIWSWARLVDSWSERCPWRNFYCDWVGTWRQVWYWLLFNFSFCCGRQVWRRVFCMLWRNDDLMSVIKHVLFSKYFYFFVLITFTW